MPRLRQLPRRLRELLRGPRAVLQRRAPRRRHGARRLRGASRRPRAVRRPDPQRRRRVAGAARPRGAAAVRRRHGVLPHEAARAGQARAAPRRCRARRARPSRRQVRQGVRREGDRDQHQPVEGSGGRGEAWRRRVLAQHQRRTDEGSCRHHGWHHRHGLGGARPDAAHHAAADSRQARPGRIAGKAGAVSTVPSAIRWEERGGEHDRRDEGHAGDGRLRRRARRRRRGGGHRHGGRQRRNGAAAEGRREVQVCDRRSQHNGPRSLAFARSAFVVSFSQKNREMH